MINPEIDWSNPAAIEAALEAEGLGAIKDANERNTTSLILHYAGETSPTMPVRTVRDTLARYEDDELGGAMATHFTGALVAELPLDGSIDDTEADAVDQLVSTIFSRGLEGLTVEQISRGLGIRFDLGGLMGLLEARELLVGMKESGIVELRMEFLSGDEYTTEEVVYDDEYGDEEIESPNEEARADSENLTDDSGEEFEL